MCFLLQLHHKDGTSEDHETLAEDKTNKGKQKKQTILLKISSSIVISRSNSTWYSNFQIQGYRSFGNQTEKINMHMKGRCG